MRRTVKKQEHHTDQKHPDEKADTSLKAPWRIKIGLLLGPARAPFLILTPACMILGYASTAWSSGHVSFRRFLLALIGGVAAHISVNAFNEFSDFKTGLDFKTERTPFSGGSGTLQKEPSLSRWALGMAVAGLGITSIIGLYFAVIVGWALLPLGILGIFIIIAYTGWLTRNPYSCLVAPGIGFGPLMVIGTAFVLTGRYSVTAAIVSLVPFFLVSNLLLLNQFPDSGPDRTIGRRHFPIAIGRRKSSVIYGTFLSLSYLSIAGGVAIGRLPAPCLMGLLTIVLAVPTFIDAYRHAEAPGNLVPAMGMNVLINLLTPALVALGLLAAPRPA
jgi:1,4-dihydroxy-2-naphthoate octaprenyltransferase